MYKITLNGQSLMKPHFRKEVFGFKMVIFFSAMGYIWKRKVTRKVYETKSPYSTTTDLERSSQGI